MIKPDDLHLWSEDIKQILLTNAQLKLENLELHEELAVMNEHLKEVYSRE